MSPCVQPSGGEEGEAPGGSLQQLEPEWELGSVQAANQRAVQWAAAHPEGSRWGGGLYKPADMTPDLPLPWVHQPQGKLEYLQVTAACQRH